MRYITLIVLITTLLGCASSIVFHNTAESDLKELSDDPRRL